MGQCLRLCFLSTGDVGSISGQGTRFHVPQLSVWVLQLCRKRSCMLPQRWMILCAAAKTWHSQIHKETLKKKSDYSKVAREKMLCEDSLVNGHNWTQPSSHPHLDLGQLTEATLDPPGHPSWQLSPTVWYQWMHCVISAKKLTIQPELYSPSNLYVEILLPPSTSECDCIWT